MCKRLTPTTGFYPARLAIAVPSSQSHKKNCFAVAMAGEELGYDYGMMPGFPDADMNDARFDSNSTPPLA